MIEILVNTGYNQPNRALDITEDITFSINYEIAKIQNIADSNGSYTKSLQLPNTAHNRAIFGYATNLGTDLGYNYDSQFSNSFSPNKKVKCFVLENSIPILDGYLQLPKYNINSIENNTTIDVTIFADNVNLYQSMGDSLLTDLDFREYSFTFSQAHIQSTWTNNPDAFKTGVYFPFADYGNGFTLDDLNNENIYKYGIKDLLPAVYVKTLADKLFSTYNITVQSNFLGSNKTTGVDVPDPRFGNLIIPYYQQKFQTGSTFSNDKIFHVGLDTDTVGQYATYSMDVYQSGIGGGSGIPGGGGTATGVAKAIFNAVHSPADSVRYLWFDGFIINPWEGDVRKNTFNNPDAGYTFKTHTIPFSLTASPMFNTNVGGGDTYDTSNFWYENRAGSIFSQKFVLNTDIVTTYSRDYENKRGTGHKYIISVEFFREFDPLTGTTDPAWSIGKGFPIPGDLGLNPIAVDTSGATESMKHWVCDINGNSNCFDMDGQTIIPIGTNRYLGKYCTSFRGDKAFEATNDGSTYSTSFIGTNEQYPNNSGTCITWYYNDTVGQLDPTSLTHSEIQKGLWCSGFDNNELFGVIQGAFPTNSSADKNQAPNHPAYGDWYQRLQLQTISLDGSSHPLFGPTGSLVAGGTTPLFPNEKVRCVVTVGSTYGGRQLTKTGTTIDFRHYVPPICAYLLSYTDFKNNAAYPTGEYQNPIVANRPLTQFYNVVSNDIIPGQYVNFNDVIPKNMKQRDFLQELVRMHNLYIEPSKSSPNTLIIEPREDFYRLGGNALDWSNKIDLTTPIGVQILANTQTKRTTFTYKTDGDWFNKLYTQATNEIYGEFKHILDNEFLTGETKIESIFSPTPLASLYSYFGDSGGNSLTKPGAFILPVFVNGNNVKPSSNAGPSGAVQINYRMLLKKVVDNQNSDTIKIFGNSTHTYPYAGPFDDPYNPQYCVNWGQTLGEFIPTNTSGVFNNLVNTYWSGLLAEMNDMDSRIITCSMYLTAKDILDFNFYKLIFLSINGVDGYYKVNSIEDYIPGHNTVCKVTLLKSKAFLQPKIFGGSIS